MIPQPGQPDWFGYTPNPEATERIALEVPRVWGEQLDNLPFDPDKPALIYRSLAKCLEGSKWIKDGRLLNQNQGRHGSCVGHGTSVSADTTAACDIHIRKQLESWPVHPVTGKPIRSAPDWLYGASRHISGTLARWQGSFGSAAAKCVSEWGMVYQRPYGDLDLSTYSAARCDQWDTHGVPANTIQIAKEHHFRSTVRVKTVEHAMALIQNGYGFNMCCGLGWSNKRDGDGFSRVVTTWAHSQAVVGYSVTNGRRGFVVVNSWPSHWNSGPLGEDTPDLPWCSYKAEVGDIAKAISQGDCWAYGGFQGFPPQKLPDYGATGVI